MKHDNALEEVVAAEIEPLEFHPEVGNNLIFLLRWRGLDALLRIAAKP